MTALFTKPEGSPEALTNAAAAQRNVAASLDMTRASLSSQGGSLADVWGGDSSLAAVAALGGTASLVDSIAAAVSSLSTALASYAGALETFQTKVDDLNARFDSAKLRYQRRPFPPTTTAEHFECIDEQHIFDETDRSLWMEFHSAKEAFDAAAAAVSSVVSADVPAVVENQPRGMNDWIEAITLDITDQVPVLGEFVALGFTAADIGSGAMALKDAYRLRAALQAFKLNPIASPLTAPGGFMGRFLDNLMINKGIISEGFLNGMATGRYSGSLSKFLMGAPIPVANTLVAGQKTLVASRTLSVAQLAKGASFTGTLANVGAVRTLGIAGSVVMTGVSAVNLISQGNPIEAFEAKGTEYLQDVAEFGFNASMTAAMIAPSPVTFGAAAITGLAYGGLAIWNNREAIVEGIGNAYEATSEFVGDVTENVSKGMEVAGEAIGEAADAVGNAIGDAASWLNPFD